MLVVPVGVGSPLDRDISGSGTQLESMCAVLGLLKIQPS